MSLKDDFPIYEPSDRLDQIVNAIVDNDIQEVER